MMRRKEEKAGKKVTRRNAMLKIYGAHASQSFSKKPSFERLYVILSNRAGPRLRWICRIDFGVSPN